MSKQSIIKQKVLLENISKEIDIYRKSNNQKNIEEIKKYLMDAFNVQYVLLWQYQSSTKKILSLDQDNRELDVQKSLIKRVVESKKPQIENHLISHKAYNPQIDNPFEYPLKSMIIFPVLEDELVQGVVVLAKDRRQRILFEREEIVRIDKLQVALLPLIKNYQPVVSVEPEKKSVEKEQVATSPVIKKTVYKKPKEYSKTVDNSNASLDIESKDIPIKTNYTMAKLVEPHDEALQLEISALKEEIASLKAKEEVNSEIEQANRRYINTIEKMRTSQKNSEKHVTYLESKIKTFEAKTMTLESKNKRNSPTSKLTIESLLMQTLPNLVQCEQIYILYEFIMYELQGSFKSVCDIDSKIKKSKLLWELLQEVEYGPIIPVNKKLTNMTMLIAKLNTLQDKFLLETLNIELTLDAKMPTVLNIDTEKVVNLCFHLLSDITQFIDLEFPLNVGFRYKDDVLYAHMKGTKHESLDRWLNKRKFTTNSEDRIALAMSQKIVEILSGELESYMEGNYCIHQLAIPASRN